VKIYMQKVLTKPCYYVMIIIYEYDNAIKLSLTKLTEVLPKMQIAILE